jgi:hypothetical protein
MSIQGLVHIKKALTNLNPEGVRQLSQYPVQIAVYADRDEDFQRISTFLLADLQPGRREQSSAQIKRYTQNTGKPPDVVLYAEGTPAPANAIVFRNAEPERTIRMVLKRHADLGVSLSRNFPPFRDPFVQQVIATTAKENTLFSLMTALPDVIPNLIELPWAVAEFASDTAFLTMNQLKMAFLIAAASDREIGYREQKSEIATVIASAFGWRAIARQLVGKVPFGGGLIAKSAVAFAATRVLGLSLDRYYRVGYTYSREERDELYSEAFERGKTVAFRILSYLRPEVAAKAASKMGRGSTPSSSRNS